MNTNSPQSTNNISNYKVCERCKSSQAILSCAQCSPLHSFCSKCDTAVHNLPSKMTHQRTNLISTNIISNEEAEPKPSSVPLNNSEPLYYYPSSKIPYIETNRNRADDYKTTYTKDYVTELKNIHQKEKNELLFKISSLENTLERLKGSFGEHINKMHNSVEDTNKETNTKIKHIEEENALKMKKLEDEKNLEIDTYKEEVEKFKNVNKEIMDNFRKNEDDFQEYKEKASNQINELYNELQTKNEEIETIKKDTTDRLNQITNEYENKINSLISSHEEEVTEQNIKNKINMDSLTNEIEQKSREIYLLNQKIEDTEKKYHQLLDELNKENEALRHELQYTQEQNTTLFEKYKFTENSMINLQNENEVAMKSLNRQREELNRKGEEIVFLENSLKSLQNTNDVLQEKNNKLQRDYTQLYSHAENMNYEYSTKLKSLNYIEDKNFVLERENNELRNKIGRYVRPYSFNK